MPNKTTTRRLGQAVASIGGRLTVADETYRAGRYRQSNLLIRGIATDIRKAQNTIDVYGVNLTPTAMWHARTLRGYAARAYVLQGRLDLLIEMYREHSSDPEGVMPDHWTPLAATVTDTTETLWQWGHNGYESDPMSEHEARKWAERHDSRSRSIDDPAMIRKLSAGAWQRLTEE